MGIDTLSVPALAAVVVLFGSVTGNSLKRRVEANMSLVHVLARWLLGGLNWVLTPSRHYSMGVPMIFHGSTRRQQKGVVPRKWELKLFEHCESR